MIDYEVSSSNLKNFNNRGFLSQFFLEDIYSAHQHPPPLIRRTAAIGMGLRYHCLIFPEGTVLSPNGIQSSNKWAVKFGLPPRLPPKGQQPHMGGPPAGRLYPRACPPSYRHVLHPRTTGLLFCASMVLSLCHPTRPHTDVTPNFCSPRGRPMLAPA